MRSTMILMVCFLILFPFQTTSGQSIRKNKQQKQREQEMDYKPIEEVKPISDINTGSGAYPNCFYYGDPSGMYLDKEWQYGKALLKDGSSIEGQFRFNLYNQKMEAIVEGDTFAFAQPFEIEMVQVGDKRFRYCAFTRDNGEHSVCWFECLAEGKCSLFLRRFIKYRLADGDGNPSNDQLYRLEEYYTCHGEGSLEHLYLSKKEVLSSLGDHQKMLKSYIKEENIRVKDQDDLVELFSYYNDLK